VDCVKVVQSVRKRTHAFGSGLFAHLSVGVGAEVCDDLHSLTKGMVDRVTRCTAPARH
jgi:hypothetical protein